MNKIRVLLITSMPWREDNNIGNSYSNIFTGLGDNIEFAHIYCRSGMPQNSLCHRYYQITEGELIRNIRNKTNKVGHAFYIEDSLNTSKEIHSNTYNRLRILRWELFFITRNWLWDWANWMTPDLDKFVEDFKPDMIFGTLTYMPNINKLMVYLKRKFNIPLVTYCWDDVYSLKQLSFSPFYWYRRISQRKYIKRCVNECSFMYVIDDMMKREYRRYFPKTDLKLLYKGYDFDVQPDYCCESNKPIKFVFMGNIGAGRWKTLSLLAKELYKINAGGTKAQLYIYTLSPLSECMKKSLEYVGTSQIMTVVPNDRVLLTQRNADVLIHVEPFDLSERLFYRLSFSTKLVDYFFAGRCILGIGGITASLDYLEEKDAGIVVYSINQLEYVIKKIISDPNLISLYAQKAWTCGEENHKRVRIQQTLYNDFLKIASYND